MTDNPFCREMTMECKDQAVTVQALLGMKKRGETIACLTAYDASFSRLLDQSGVDIILVGDSLGMVIKGEQNTLSVTMDEMVYHSCCVAKARKRAWLIADLPFMSYSSLPQAAKNSARLVREGYAQMVKLEGGGRCADTIQYLVEQGIPVCGHLGLTPQSIHRIGGFRVQGKDPEVAARMKEDAVAIEEAGADLLVLECIPRGLAAEITRSLSIPTIGIGAGEACDGQVLVLQDMLGMGAEKKPRFARDFLADTGRLEAAVKSYVKAVREGEFPATEHAFE